WGWFAGKCEKMAIENEFTMQELRDLREVFQVYDPSNTGSLTISDFRKVIKVLGFTVTRRRLQELMKEEEIGKEGLITLSPEDIDGMITEANRDGTGLITLQEFIEVMQRTAIFN
uniref:EF-hand domain-containing protein n=1 Tax=Amphimedon queenslandica TaxID=400682 RepID=A0A1X7SZG4_AMPQE